MSTTPGFWKCVKCRTPNPGTVYISSCIACGFPRPAPGFESLSGEAPKPDVHRHRKPRSRVLMAIVAGYGLVLMAAFLLAWGIGDAWWPGFVLSLMPRAVFLVPLVPLGLWAWRARRPIIGGAVALEALFVAGPLMGFVVPWARLTARADGPTIRIMTFNRGGARGFDTADFLRYIDRQKIDVVCFQEFADDPTLDRVLAERSWHRDRSRAIATRFPIVEDYPRSKEINEADGHYTALLYRVRLAGPDGREFVVGCLHMPTSRYAFRRLFRLDPSGMTPYLNWWNAELLRMFELVTELNEFPTLIGGDFNNGPNASRWLSFARASSSRRSTPWDGAGATRGLRPSASQGSTTSWPTRRGP